MTIKIAFGTSYLIAIVMFAIKKICTNNIKCKHFDLENEGQGEEGKKRGVHHST